MKKLKSLAIVIFVAVITLAFVACGKTDPVIKVGDDEIPSLYSVVGERSISGTSTSISNGVHTKEKTYAAGEVSQEDIDQYLTSLQDSSEFIVTKAAEQSGTTTTAQLAKESVSSGKVIVVNVVFDSAGSTVLSYQVGEGTLDIY